MFFKKCICFRSVLTLVVALAVTSLSVAQEVSGSSQSQEAMLLGVLQSDAPVGDKAVTCKELAIHGSSAAVPHLAPLLSDPELASWARIALEAIPGPEADKALRDAAESLEGLLLVGTINSVGVRRDAHAVDLLAKQMLAADAEVGAAAAVALGKIGNDAAAQRLVAALATAGEPVRSAVAEGCVLCAEQRRDAGKMSEAVELYDAVRQAAVAKQRIVEATRGSILARGDAGVPLLEELLQSNDVTMFRLALSTAREFPGSKVDAMLANAMQQATPDRAALMVWVMADRPETVDLKALVQAAEQGPTAVRLAAIQALALVGDQSCLSALLRCGADSDTSLASAARETLAELAGEAVNQEIVNQLASSDGAAKALLIEIVGRRRIPVAEKLLPAAKDDDDAIRHAALGALGEVVTLDQLSVLIDHVLQPRKPADASVAQQALLTASVRMADREACAALLAAAMPQAASTDLQQSLLEVLGNVGGTNALAALADAARSPSDELQDTSTRLLGQWMTADAAPVLLDLTNTAPEEKYQTRALRGYIRIARQFVLPEEERVAMCQRALAAAKNAGDKKLVLDVLQRYPNPRTLELAADLVSQPELTQQARATALVILHAVGDRIEDPQPILAKLGLEQVELEIVKAQYGSGANQKDVTEILAKQVKGLPLITLPARTYNGAFGDPAPSTQKQLSVQYRINGQLAEATFRENALIVLPLPR